MKEKFATNGIFICEYKIIVVLLHRISELPIMKYKDATCYIADIEDMTEKSYRTARRIMAKVRKHYGITGRAKPTIQQVQAYLVAIS